MKYLAGQGLLGKIRFIDGEFPLYDRPYLIVQTTSKGIKVLNVSSVLGKERKLTYHTNVVLHNFSPPFLQQSFVKIDSLTEIDYAECAEMRLLSNGQTLNEKDLNHILSLLSKNNEL